MSDPVEGGQEVGVEGPGPEGAAGPPRGSLINRVVAAFLRGNSSILLLVLSLIAGGAALTLTPREEDPQIVVPVANVFVSVPGASVEEVERQVATRLEKLISQIDGIEYVYSVSRPGRAVVTARFFVGEDREESWVRLNDKIQANVDQLPPGVSGWVVKPVEIDDVPIVAVSLFSAAYDDHALRRMAEELEIRLQGVPNAGRTVVVGGRARELTLRLSPQAMAARGVGLSDVRAALTAANVRLGEGQLTGGDVALAVRAGAFLEGPEDVAGLVVGTPEGRPVYMREVAEVSLGPAEAERYTRLALGAAAFAPGDPGAGGLDAVPADLERFRDYPSVTVAVAKRRGTNAVWVSDAVKQEAGAFAAEVLPADVHLRFTRDYGASADHKVEELIEALLVAIAIVIALLAYSLGWREGLIIALAVPITFSLTLLVNLLLGYSINRVTLFALILALGLVVDDPIVDVENVHRHLKRLGGRSRFRAVIEAVNEVRPPIILATLAVIISFVPLFFITGMMGPYMAPMALNVPVAMLASLVVAFTITPWLCYHLLPAHVSGPGGEPPLERTGLYRAYQAALGPLLRRRGARAALLSVVLALLALSGWLVLSRRVPLKMLPFDNKNELQVMVDLPEGTTLERTEAVAAELAAYLVRVPEVTEVTWYAGTASPIDFNGLVRQYDLRQAPELADLRIGLLHKTQRSMQSHGVGLRVRRELTRIARAHGARLELVEIPPGPPVMATLVAEVYGSPFHGYADLVRAAGRVREHLQAADLVVDVDDVAVAEQVEVRFRVDRTKAALHGISEQDAADFLATAFAGAPLTALRLPDQVQPVYVVARLPRSERQRPEDLLRLYVPGPEGAMVPLRELGTIEVAQIEQPVYHKNLRPVAYAFADTAGKPPAEAVLELGAAIDADPALRGFDVRWAGEGEWKITLDAFRDLGIAFGVAVLGIYVLLIYQTGSYLLPLVLLIAIPLTVIGIVPGFYLLNLLTAGTIDGFPDPVFFTATAMIGMIALAGIATRNAILLIEFVEEARARGVPLDESLIQAGALRTRPILLTAGTALLAAWPITLDPIFSGLAWALIFGLVVSTAFTLLVVPTVYFMVYRRRDVTPGGRTPPAEPEPVSAA